MTMEIIPLRAFPIRQDGLGSPVLSSAGSPHEFSNENMAIGQMKFSEDGTKLGVVFNDGQNNRLEIFNFDDSLGTLEEYVLLDLSNEGQAYGLEFSRGGTKAFVSFLGSNSRVEEFRIDTTNVDVINDSRVTISTVSGGPYGAMQRGPDGQIYVAKRNANNVAAINDDDITEADPENDVEFAFNQSSFNENGVPDGIRGISLIGLPNFVRMNMTSEMEPAISISEPGCIGSEVAFSAAGSSDIDEFFWTIRNELGAVVSSFSNQDTTIIFDEPGLFDVALDVFNRCGFDTTLVQQFRIFPTPPEPTMPDAISLCGTGGTVIDAYANFGGAASELAGLSYLWNTGDTTRTITVNSEGIFSVTVTNEGGCSNEGQVFVGPPFDVDLGADRVLCDDEQITLDANVTAPSYQWSYSLDGTNFTNLGTARTQNISAALLAGNGDYTIRVAVEDPIQPGCEVVDEVRVLINETPEITVSSSLANCGADDASLTVVLQSANPIDFIVTDSQGVQVGQGSLATPSNAGQTINNLGAGAYTVVATDQASGCETTSTHVIEQVVGTFEISSVTPSPADCDDQGGSIAVLINTSTPFSGTYRLTGNGVNISDNVVAQNFTIPNLASGTYNLEVTSNGGCVDTEINILVESVQEAEFELLPTANECSDRYNVQNAITEISPGLSFTLFDATDPSDTGTSNLEVTSSGRYRVVGEGTGLCPLEREILVTITAPPQAVITEQPSEACDTSKVLIATNANAEAGQTYIFDWFSGTDTNGTPLGRGTQITARESGAYTVRIRNNANPNSSCTNTATINVTVNTPPNFRLERNPACEGEEVTVEVVGDDLAGITFTWAFIPRGGGAEQSLPNTGTIITADNGDGIYIARGNRNGCEIERTIEVRRSPIGEIVLPERFQYCPDDPVAPQLDAGAGFATYEWYVGNTLVSTLRTVNVDRVGTYRVVATTSAGCQTEASTDVFESCGPRVRAPNAIEPNSNDPGKRLFYVYTNDFVDEFEVLIYNRWGELIFYSTDKEFQWDATYKGKEVPLGTYPIVFILRNNASGDEVTLRTSVTVIK